MSDVAFKPLTAIEKIFKSLVWDPMIKLGETAIEGYVPVLALPVIKQLEEFSFEEVTDWLFNNFVMFVDVSAIKLVNAEHHAAYVKESLRLLLVSQTYPLGSPEFQKENEIAKQNLAQFVGYGATRQ